MEVTKVLLEHGSQVDPVDGDMHTPLHEAYKRGDAETCELLVSFNHNTYYWVLFCLSIITYTEYVFKKTSKCLGTTY